MTKRIQSTYGLSLVAALLLSAWAAPGVLFAQDLEVLCDWEEGGTCWNWDFVDGATTFEVVDNPAPDALNSTAKVQQFTTDPANGFPIFVHDYAANGESPVDFTQFGVFKLKVYTTVAGGSVLLKFENADNSESQERSAAVTPGAWQELIFQFNFNSSTPLVKMVIFPNFLTVGTPNDGTWYFDDLKQTKAVDTAIEDDLLPSAFSLEQNYPNPFNPSTTIRYTTDQAGPVHLNVYNMLGEEVATLVNQFQPSGEHTVTFDASELTSGVYLYRFTYGNNTVTRKMMLMK